MKRLKAFTLIELLVVIAIIGLLMSIVVPALRRAQTVAWEVICRNNLRHYGIAGVMYAEDYDQFFPNAWDSIYRSRGEPGHPRVCQFHDRERSPLRRPDLAGSLWPYLDSQDKSHQCALFQRFARQHHQCPSGSQIPVDPIFGYSMNAFLGGFENDHVLKVRTSDIRTPSSIFFFAEENPWVNPDRYVASFNDNALCGAPVHPNNPAAWSSFSRDWNPEEHSGRLQDSLATFHQTSLDRRDDGLSNVVFVDGHVSMQDWRDTYRLSRWTNRMPPLHR